jgi:hypothetical protein
VRQAEAVACISPPADRLAFYLTLALDALNFRIALHEFERSSGRSVTHQVRRILYQDDRFGAMRRLRSRRTGG